MSAFVDIENLGYSYGPLSIFRGFNLKIEKGECVAVTGPSGCGKSTLAQVAAGHLQPDTGRIVVDNREVNGRPGRDVFLVAQDSDLFPWQTVEKQIQFALLRADPARVQYLIKLTKLAGFENHFPRQLSGGMRKRLSIARALAVDPKLIIFDESFNSLDFEMRRALFADLKEIWRRTQTTILFITHDPRDVVEIGEREIKMGSSYS